LGDNASQPAPMTADDQTITPAAGVARLIRSARERVRASAPDALLRLARPYVHRRSGAASAAELVHLKSDFEHVSERHTEQIERLEDLVRELVLATEALRRSISDARPAPGAREDAGARANPASDARAAAEPAPRRSPGEDGGDR
jgi:hypothetical protein